MAKKPRTMGRSLNERFDPKRSASPSPATTTPPEPKVTHIPDLDPGPLLGIDPRRLRGKDEKLWRFVLALAVAFNDFKGFQYLLAQLHKIDGRGLFEKSPAQLGEVTGMATQLSRVISGSINELCVLIEEHSKVIESAAFQRLLATLPKKPRDRWQSVVDVALNRSMKGSVGFLLILIRNNFAFHYGAKSIANGYDRFLASKTALNERAAFSVGPNMQSARFYFADAAAEGAFEAAVERTRYEFEKEINSLLWDINEALYTIVAKYIQSIGGGVAPYTPKRQP